MLARAVQASIAANTYVVSGPSQVKSLSDLQDLLGSGMMAGLGGMGLGGMGPDNLANLKKLAQQVRGMWRL